MLHTAISNAIWTSVPCISKSAISPTVETTRRVAISTVGKPYSCRPVKVARKTPKGSAKATEKPTAMSPQRTSPTRAPGIWVKRRGTCHTMPKIASAPGESAPHHDSECSTDRLARRDGVACCGVFRNEFADSGLQPEVEKIHIGGELQDQHPRAVLRRTQVMHQKVRQHQGNKHAQNDACEVGCGPLEDPAFIETRQERRTRSTLSEAV